jgi:hypothetical protein
MLRPIDLRSGEIMLKRLVSLTVVLVVWILLLPTVTASQSRYQSAHRRSPPTIRQSLAYLDRDLIVTKEQFRLWTGLHPIDGRFATRWRLADGVLVTNYMELSPGRLAIACWQVEKR